MLISLDEHGLALDLGGHCIFAGQNWTNHPHRHPEFQEICWVTAGSGCFRHDGERVSLAVGSCFISEPDVLHEIYSESHDLELFFMTFRQQPGTVAAEPDAEAVWRRYQEQHQIHCQIPGTASYWDLIRSAPYPLRSESLMRCLFLESLAMLSGYDHDQDQVATGDDPAHQAMAYIRQHAQEAPGVARIAAAVDLSERQLRRRFKAVYGCGLVEAINQVRLDQARRLLLMQHSVSATAQAVGIASPAMFSRLFKQAFGCTPGQWQRAQVEARDVSRTVFGSDRYS